MPPHFLLFEKRGGTTPKVLLESSRGAAPSTTPGRLSWPPKRRGGSRARSGAARRWQLTPIMLLALDVNFQPLQGEGCNDPRVTAKNPLRGFSTHPPVD